MRHAIAFLLTITLLSVATAHADVSGVEVSLASGEVVGKTRGLGTADVTAKVTNNTTRTLDGIRLAAFYSPADVFPAADADWRIHEFVFEPPLTAGASSTLQFSDDSAAQYILLEARAVKYRAALRLDGQDHELTYPVVKRDGVAYIALRDMAEVLGWTVLSTPGRVTLEKDGFQLWFYVGSSEYKRDGKPGPLAHPILDQSGRSFIALRDVAALHEVDVSDLGDDLYELK